MFRVFDHENVSILDGGFAKWQKEGKTVTTDLPDFPTESYVARKDSRRAVDKSNVTAAIPSDTCCILNALEESRAAKMCPGANCSMMRDAFMTPRCCNRDLITSPAKRARCTHRGCRRAGRRPRARLAKALRAASPDQPRLP
jgi:hypothetical protein